MIDEEEFNFHSYVFTPLGTALLHLIDQHNQEIVLSPRDILTPLALLIMAIVAPTLLSPNTKFGKVWPSIALKES